MNKANTLSLAARLDALPVGRWHGYLVVICILAMAFDGFDMQVIAPIFPKLVGEWKISNVQVGLLSSAGFAGMAIGAVLFGLIADGIGRLKVLTISLLWYALLSGFCALTTGFNSLLIMRFITGIGLGGLIPVVSSYVAEYVPSRRRGQYVVYTAAGIQVGTILAFVVGFVVVVPYGWRYGFILGVLPAFVILWVWKVLPESVRYLLHKERIAEAVKIVEKIELTALGKVTVPFEQAVEGEKHVSHVEEKARYRDLFKGGLAKATVMLVILHFCVNFAAFSLTMWLPILLTRQLGYGLSFGLVLITIATVLGIAGYISAGYVCEHWGRKASLTCSFLLYGIIGYVLFLVGKDRTLGAASLCVLQIANGCMWGSLLAYTAENFPTRVRATGTGLAYMVGRLGAICGPTVVGFEYGTFGIFGVLHIIMALLVLAPLLVLILGKETKGKTLEQISMLQMRGTGG